MQSGGMGVYQDPDWYERLQGKRVNLCQKLYLIHVERKRRTTQ